MLITLPLNRGFSFYPLIVIPSWASGIESYVAHEQIHYDRQGGFIKAIVWVYKYFTSKSFRFREEVLAFAEEYRVARASGSTASINRYADVLYYEYWGCCTKEAALEALVKELELNG